MTGRHVPGFTGDLIAPGDERYEQARRVWNAAVDRCPALIARAQSTADVVAVVRYAREKGLPLSVRGGGVGRLVRLVGLLRRDPRLLLRPRG